FVEQHHPPGDLVARRSRRVVLGNAEVDAEELENRKPRYGLAVGDPVRCVDRDSPRAAALGELEAEAALAEAREGDAADDLTVAFDRPRERRLECGHLIGTANEARESPRARHLEFRAELPDSLKLVNPNRLLHSLERESPEILQRHKAVDERCSVL